MKEASNKAGTSCIEVIYVTIVFVEKVEEANGSLQMRITHMMVW